MCPTLAPSPACTADWFKYGAGVTNYLAVPDLPLDSKHQLYDLPGGYIMGGDLSSVKPFKTAADPIFREAVVEDTATPTTRIARNRSIRGRARPNPTTPSGTPTRSTPG